MTDSSRSWVEGMAEAYDTWLVPTVFAPFAEDLVRRIADAAPAEVLELGAGSGALTRAMIDIPGAAITATDLNVAMVDVGRANVPAADWQQADAMALPFADAAFDTITGQFVAMFFPDKPRAFGEVRRCLRGDGAVVFNTWGPISEHDFETAVMAGLEAYFGDDAPRFLEQVPHGYNDIAQVETDLQAGGLELRHAEQVELVGRAESSRRLAEGYCRGTPIRNAVVERSAAVDEVIDAVHAALAEQLGPDPIVGRMSAVVFEAALS
jgi:SAM-dependent methyltransferase